MKWFREEWAECHTEVSYGGERKGGRCEQKWACGGGAKQEQADAGRGRALGGTGRVDRRLFGINRLVEERGHRSVEKRAPRNRDRMTMEDG